jgi:hypothetical protein
VVSTIKSLKDEFNLMTGDELPAKPKPVDDHDAVREQWSYAKKRAFREMGPAALCIVATDGPVSVVTYDERGNVAARFGHNRGCWPALLARTASWADTITKNYNKSPFFWIGVQIRVWASSVEKRDRLAEAVTDLLAHMSEEAMGATLLNGYRDIGPEIDLALLEMEIQGIAERLKIGAWDDAGLSAKLDEDAAREERKKVAWQ